MHAKLHGLSRKYDIPDLRRRTCDLLPPYMRHAINNAETDDLQFLDDLQFSKDIIDTAKIIYGSTQETDRSIKEAIIYAAQRLAKFLGRHDNNRSSKPLRSVGRLSDEFVWDMLSMDFSRTVFRCNICHNKFTFDASSSETLTECDCAARGVCGKCSPVRQLPCKICYDVGKCEVLRRTEEEPGDGMEQTTEKALVS